MSTRYPESRRKVPRPPRDISTVRPPPHLTPVERFLWTPTEGEDLTKAYFPLSPSAVPDERDADNGGRSGR
jgi:hypothetical protein